MLPFLIRKPYHDLLGSHAESRRKNGRVHHLHACQDANRKGMLNPQKTTAGKLTFYQNKGLEIWRIHCHLKAPLRDVDHGYLVQRAQIFTITTAATDLRVNLSDLFARDFSAP